MMKKRLSKTLWYGSDIDKEGKPVLPPLAEEANDLEGIHEGELYLHLGDGSALLFTRSADGQVVQLGSNADELANYLLKSVWDKAFEFRTTENGEEYLFTKLNLATQYGITMYANGGLLDLPSIFDGIPFDNKTIWLNPETKVVEVIGSTEEDEGGADFSNVKTSGEGNAFTSFVLSDDGKELTFVKGETFAKQSDFTALNAKVTDFLEGSDTDDIINKWKELETFLSGMKESDDLATILATKWTKDDAKIANWDDAFGWGDHSKVGYLKKEVIYDESIGCWKLEGDLLVTGGITMYANEGQYTPSTITDAVNIDNNTLIRVNGVIMLNPDIEIGGGTDIDLSEYAKKATTLSGYGITDAYTKTAVDGLLEDKADTATTLAGYGITNAYTKTQVDNLIGDFVTSDDVETLLDDYLPLTGGTITGDLRLRKGSEYTSPYLYFGDSDEVWMKEATDTHLTIHADGSVIIDADLIVKGGITMFANEGKYTPSTITDAVNIDNNTLVRVNGVIMLNPDIEFGGGVADSVAWKNIDGVPTWITDSKPVYKYTEIDGTPDLSVYALKTSLANYLPLVGGTLTGELTGTTFIADDVYWSNANGTTLSSVGWYRFATSERSNAAGCTYIISICRSYYYANNEAYLIAATLDHSGVSFTQLAGHRHSTASYQLITKIRCTRKNSGEVYFDFYYNGTLANTLYVNVIGHAKVQVPTLTTTELAYTDEFELDEGVKSSLGFVGDLKGNASTASALKTPRMIWGQSFDGSGNVSGDMTGVGNVTMGGQLSLNGITIKKSANGVLFVDGNLVVSGGVTMYGTDGTTANTIWDDAPIANTNGKKGVASYDPNFFAVNNGVVTFVGQTGGGGVTDYNDLTGKPDLSVYALKTSLSSYQTKITSTNKLAYDLISGTPTIPTNTNQLTNGAGFITSSGSITGNAATATALKNARTIWGNSFDGSANVSGNIALSTSKIFWHGDSSNYYISCPSDTGGAGLMYKAYSSHRFVAGGAERLTILSSGYIGIGTTTPQSKLQVDQSGWANGITINRTVSGGGSAIAVRSNGTHVGNFGISGSKQFEFSVMSGTSEQVKMTVDSSGNGLFYGGVTMYSDLRKKTILNHVELSLKEVADAPLIEHYYNSDESKRTHVGSVAQYWAGLNDWFCKEDGEGFLTMEIQNAALASAISVARELTRYESKTDKQIKKLKKRIGELEEEIENLKKV